MNIRVQGISLSRRVYKNLRDDSQWGPLMRVNSGNAGVGSTSNITLRSQNDPISVSLGST